MLERTCTQTGETASLAVPGIGGLTYVDEVTPDRGADRELAGPYRGAARHVDRQGAARVPPAERGAAGAAPTTLPAFTDTTITTPDELAAELAATRARGYGTCAGELESSLYGVSAPVLDRTGRPLAVLSIWGPKDRVPEERFAELGAIVVEAAREVGTGDPTGRRPGGPPVVVA